MNTEGIGFWVLGLGSVRDVRVIVCHGAKGSKIWGWGLGCTKEWTRKWKLL